MNKEEITAALRVKGLTATPVETARYLDELMLGKLSDFTLIVFFKLAFPDIPLRILRETEGWNGVVKKGGGMSDSDFNELLRPWIPITSGGGTNSLPR